MGFNIRPWFLLFMISTFMPFSNGSRDTHQICSSSSTCGNLKDIKYPFWVDTNQPIPCAHPLFKLECSNTSHYPYLWVKELRGSYEVCNINSSTHTVELARDKNQTCHVLVNSGQTFSDRDSYFEFGANVASLTLSCGCLEDSGLRSFQCQELGVNASVYYLDTREEFISKKCQTDVSILVSKKALDEFVKNTSGTSLETVLEAPFEVEYKLGDEKPGKRKSQKILGLGITGGAILVMTALVVVAICYRKKLNFCHSNSRALSCHNASSDLENGSLYFGVPLFSYKDLEEATNNFDESRELGNGGFGRVYYGKLRDGREVAVKQLYEKSYKRVTQFMNEVQILTCLRHQNLVSLYGCTSPQCNELLLVYEYIRNGTLADHLYDYQEPSRYLSWGTRMRIAIETANALSYLHASTSFTVMSRPTTSS